MINFINPVTYLYVFICEKEHMNNNTVTLDKIVAFCKRKGFVFPSSDIYGGLNGVYDFGPMGTLLKQNIRKLWTNSIYKSSDDIFLFEGSLLAPPAVWEASGHLENFHDPMVDCTNCKHRFRADEIDLEKPCSVCGKKAWTEIRQFNLMFKTHLGATEEKGSVGYLRPETAQAIFVNFKNVISTNRAKLPFGIAQIGKSFRNEITPKQFLFRTREFEQMELEWFCKPESSMDAFNFWMEERKKFYKEVGLNPESIRFRAHAKEDLSHYSLCCTDTEYNFPFGWKELDGLAHRTDFDLTQHSKHSGKDLAMFDEETKQSVVPHIVEWSVGVDRLFLTLLFDSYTEDEVDGESRVVLKINPKLAPIKAALLPLAKKISEPFQRLYKELRAKGYSIQIDESGSIGKRYRRQDEIGTPWCFTYDFDSESDNCVTIRNRDTTQQERININQIEEYIRKETLC